jgi:hypothetical protein
MTQAKFGMKCRLLRVVTKDESSNSRHRSGRSSVVKPTFMNYGKSCRQLPFGKEVEIGGCFVGSE